MLHIKSQLRVKISRYDGTETVAKDAQGIAERLNGPGRMRPVSRKSYT